MGRLLAIVICFYLPNLPLAKGQEVPRKIDFPEFVTKLESYAHAKQIHNGGTGAEPAILIKIGSADRELSGFPYLKSLVLGVFQDLDSISKATFAANKAQQDFMNKSNKSGTNSSRNDVRNGKGKLPSNSNHVDRQNKSINVFSIEKKFWRRASKHV